MRPIGKILVAIKDPTAISLPAVDKAIQRARAFGATVELFHAIGTHVYAGYDLATEDLADLENARLVQALTRLEAIAERVRDVQVPVKASVVKPKDFVTRVQRRTRGMKVSSPPLPMIY